MARQPFVRGAAAVSFASLLSTMASAQSEPSYTPLFEPDISTEMILAEAQFADLVTLSTVADHIEITSATLAGKVDALRDRLEDARSTLVFSNGEARYSPEWGIEPELMDRAVSEVRAGKWGEARLDHEIDAVMEREPAIREAHATAREALVEQFGDRFSAEDVDRMSRITLSYALGITSAPPMEPRNEVEASGYAALRELSESLYADAGAIQDYRGRWGMDLLATKAAAVEDPFAQSPDADREMAHDREL